MERRKPPNAGKGRPKGSPNKATADIKALSTKLLTDPDYLDALRIRLKRGTAGPVEVLLHQYAYGKPKDVTEVHGANGGPVVFRWMPLDPHGK